MIASALMLAGFLMAGTLDKGGKAARRLRRPAPPDRDSGER
jgi:hypothetical protein